MTIHPIASTRPWTVRHTLTAVTNETVKGLRHGWGERLQILIELPLFVAFILLLGYTVGQGERIASTGELPWRLDPRGAAWLFIGMATFTYTYLHVQKMFWRLLAEIQAGTLEQTYLSPLPSWVHVVAGRILAAIAETAVVVAIMYAATNLAVRLDLHWRPATLVPLAMLVVGAAGLALIIAGITLVWKRVQMLNDLVLLAVLFFSGAVLPLDQMPGWAQPVSAPLFMTHSVAGLRTVMVDNQPLALSGSGGLAWMLATSAAWFTAGLIVFRGCERIAQRRGALSHT